MLRALHIAAKDVRIWTRDVAAMGVLMGMPVVLIFILGSALGGGGAQSQIPVAVVNLDRGVTGPAPGDAPTSSRGVLRNVGLELAGLLTDSERLNDVFEIEVASDEKEAARRVATGTYAAALVVPTDFSAKIASGQPVELRVLRDPGAGLSAGIFESVVRSIAARYSAVSVGVQTAIEVAAEHRPTAVATPNGQIEVQQLVVDALGRSGLASVEVADSEADVAREMTALDFFGVTMTAMFLMFGAMFGAFSTIKERREQTLSRLLSTPASGMSVTAGKMLGIFGLGMVQFTVLYVFTRFLFRVNWGDSVAAVFLVAAAEMLAVTGLAVLIAAFARTERGAGGLGPLIVQIQALIGGAFFTLSVLPEWLQSVRFLSVIGWAIEGWQEIQLRGGGVADVVGPVAALVGFAVAFFGVGAWRTGARG